MQHDEFDTSIEFECSDCGSHFELSYNDDDCEEPIYCPYCGTDLPTSEIEEGIEDTDDFSDYIEEEDEEDDDR